jgi:hypothetical protein
MRRRAWILTDQPSNGPRSTRELESFDDAFEAMIDRAELLETQGYRRAGGGTFHVWLAWPATGRTRALSIREEVRP